MFERPTMTTDDEVLKSITPKFWLVRKISDWWMWQTRIRWAVEFLKLTSIESPITAGCQVKQAWAGHYRTKIGAFLSMLHHAEDTRYVRLYRYRHGR